MPPAARTRGAIASKLKPDPMLVVVEVMVVLAPADHAAWLIAPTVDCHTERPIGRTTARKIRATTMPNAIWVTPRLFILRMFMFIELLLTNYHVKLHTHGYAIRKVLKIRSWGSSG